MHHWSLFSSSWPSNPSPPITFNAVRPSSRAPSTVQPYPSLLDCRLCLVRSQPTRSLLFFVKRLRRNSYVLRRAAVDEALFNMSRRMFLSRTLCHPSQSLISERAEFSSVQVQVLFSLIKPCNHVRADLSLLPWAAFLLPTRAARDPSRCSPLLVAFKPIFWGFWWIFDWVLGMPVKY